MKKKIVPVIAAGALIVVVILFMLLGNLIEKYTPTKDREDLSEYYGISSDNEVAIILNNEIIEAKAKLVDNIVYLDYETVCNYLNSRFYWDANENILRYTTANDLISANAESSDYTVTKSAQSLGHTVVKADASTAYIAIDFVAQYSDFTYEVFENPNRVVLTTQWGEYTTATAKKDCEIRYQGGIKSLILADVEKNTELTILEPDETWTKVVTADGIIGYIKSKNLSSTSTKTLTSDYVEEEFTHIVKDFEINMVWHQVTNRDANSTLSSVLQNTKGINVISPTWFYLNDNNGNIASLASDSYVDYCHQNGIEVWALISNLENKDVDTTEVLSHTSNRDNLVNNIISSAIQYNLDGINVDFESLSIDAGESFIQFIRELSLKCANNGIVLSVDNYVPSDYTSFYNRAEQSVFADYIVLMAYDEHYSGSDEGSVASIGFVTKGVEDTLTEVPANQLIMAMPFYTRVWQLTPTETESETSEEESADSYVNYELSSYADSMGDIQKLISVNGAEPVWLDDCGQYYVEYENSGSIYKIWIEDAASLEEKLKVMDSYQLAGGSFWKIGLESSSVWDVIIKYIN